MHLERLILSNFRCFGPEPHTIDLSTGMTAFIGANGSGKTAVMQSLLRLFGITNEQRRITRQDFHVPIDEGDSPNQRKLLIEVIFDFPELDGGDDAIGQAVPEFFHQMASDDNGRLKCRLRLEATWSDDGSMDGVIDSKFMAVRTMNAAFEESDVSELKAIDRTRIQMVYVPAVRDPISQMTAFLRGRLWRAITWSETVRQMLNESGESLNTAFGAEPAVDVIATAVESRWQELHKAGTDMTPSFRPVDLRFQHFIQKVEVTFHPDENGNNRSLSDLSDGQRSLFHIAMTAAILDIESGIASGTITDGFQAGGVPLPVLTIIAVEEPENNLAPFYLSRIIRQIENLASGRRAQAIVSSHSASILARIEPSQVRHFRLDPVTRTSRVNKINMPTDDEDAGKFVREAVRTYPELYFARFVILGEGSSEEVVLPRLAEAMGMSIDRSFVAVVPLGGRHVNHLWRLLTDLDIPHATLLDLDIGRAGGGWGRIKTVCEQLLANGTDPHALFENPLSGGSIEATLDTFLRRPLDWTSLEQWVQSLRTFDVYFCWPLDLDLSMLRAFPGYMDLEAGMRGPAETGDAKSTVLGDHGMPQAYEATYDEAFRWYRYLFLGRGKPSTHIRVLSKLESDTLQAQVPEDIAALLRHVEAQITATPLV